MREEIESLNLDVVYGGGYYQLINIRESEQTQTFMDIYLLTEKIEDKELVKKLRAIHDLTTAATVQAKDKARSDSLVNQEKKQIFYDDIKEAMNGYARIVKYMNHSVNKVIKEDNMPESSQFLIRTSPENLEITEVHEGRYENGLKHGYNRIISARDGSCEVGFFISDVPKGKYCKYNLDGTYDKEEGLYENEQKCKTKLQLANYMQKILR